MALGNPPKNAEAIFESPYATIPLFSSFPVGSLSNPPIVVAERSPMACIALIANKIEKETTAENSNLIPNGMKRGRENHVDSPIFDRSTMPKGIETMYPTIIPIRIDASFINPFPKLLHAITTERVMMATVQFCQLPKSGLPAPPAMYLMAVG